MTWVDAIKKVTGVWNDDSLATYGALLNVF
jgi:hypothetical protein